MNREEVIKRLEAKSKTLHTCKVWTGSVIENGGYGRISVDDRKVLVHRLSASLYLGFDLLSKSKVVQTCGNPTCWNPDHLRID